MIASIICIILSIISIIFAILFIIELHKFRKLNAEYIQYKTETLKKSNKVNMVEYYLRACKEGRNIFTTVRDLNNLIYCEEDINDNKN